MLNHITKAVIDTKDFVVDHSTAFAVAATVAIGTALHVKVVGQHNDFLREHDLYDSFYNQDTEED